MNRLLIYKWSDLPRLAGVALLYGLLARVMLDFFSSNGTVSVVWPSGGLAFAALLIGGKKYWPAIFAGSFASDIGGNPVLVSAAIASGSAIGALAGVWLLTLKNRFDPALTSPSDYLCLGCAGAVYAGVDALAGCATLWLSGSLARQDVALGIWHWWRGDTLGILIMAPLILVWREWPRNWLAGPKRVAETIACFGLAFLMGQIVFLGWLNSGDSPIGYLMLVFVIWSAVRFGCHGVTLVIFMMATQALLGAIQGVGFFGADFAQTRMTNFWLYMFELTVVGMTLALSNKNRKRAEANYRLLAKVFESGSEAFMITDANNNFLAVNDAFTHITGYTKQEVIGKNPETLAAGTNSMEFYAHLWRDVFATGHWHGEMMDRRKSGEIYPRWMSVNAITDEQGNATHYIGSFIDISERRSVEKRMHHMAHHDVLTGLPNRTLFNDRLLQALISAKRNNARIALMFIDFDAFKPINDTLGHATGDLLLKEAAVRMQHCVRESDTIARIGGDEFIVLLQPIETETDAMTVAEKLCNTLKQPFELDNQGLSISASIGVAIYPENGIHELQLYRNADTAMYYAKKQGGNNVRLYQPMMQEYAAKPAV